MYFFLKIGVQKVTKVRTIRTDTPVTSITTGHTNPFPHLCRSKLGRLWHPLGHQLGVVHVPRDKDDSTGRLLVQGLLGQAQQLGPLLQRFIESTVYSLQSTVYSLQSSLQSKVYSIQYRVHSLQYTIYSIQSTCPPGVSPPTPHTSVLATFPHLPPALQGWSLHRTQDIQTFKKQFVFRGQNCSQRKFAQRNGQRHRKNAEYICLNLYIYFFCRLKRTYII